MRLRNEGGHPKISYFNITVIIYQDVGSLDVAMDNVFAVQISEGIGNLGHDHSDLWLGESPFVFGHDVSERTTRVVVHNNPNHFVNDLDAVAFYNIRMITGHQNFNLSLDVGQGVGFEIRGDYFDGVLLFLCVRVCFVDLTVGAFADQLLQDEGSVGRDGELTSHL